MEVEVINYNTMVGLVAQFHYAKVMPAQTRLCLGSFLGSKLVCASSWGWGVQPLHTIKKLFPSLVSKDYWELGKLCCDDDMPKNTESEFLARCSDFVRKNFPEKKLLYTWADGMLGKPGYVYQASGWLYGGFIWTETYFTPDGEKIHPRGYQNKIQEGKRSGMHCGKRPDAAKMKELGLKHYYGKQFRYLKFLCSRKETKRLLAETTVEWSQEYPKHADLEWKIKTKDEAGQGSRVSCERPTFTGSVRFRSPAPLFDSVEEGKK